jgi:hypothetical protein
MAEDEELGVASGGHGARAETGAREKGPRRPDAASGAPISARDRVKLFLANAEYRGLILNQTLMRAFLRLAARRIDESRRIAAERLMLTASGHRFADR